MGKKFLIDTNVIIDYYGSRLPEKGIMFIENIDVPLVSVITQIELLGWYRISVKDKIKLQEFIEDATVIQLEDSIVKRTIELRQLSKIKLPDAIVAATALDNHLDLISHNISDFKNIAGIKVIDPWNLGGGR